MILLLYFAGLQRPLPCLPTPQYHQKYDQYHVILKQTCGIKAQRDQVLNQRSSTANILIRLLRGGFSMDGDAELMDGDDRAMMEEVKRVLEGRDLDEVRKSTAKVIQVLFDVCRGFSHFCHGFSHFVKWDRPLGRT
jgi:hypothetical protein